MDASYPLSRTRSLVKDGAPATNSVCMANPVVTGLVNFDLKQANQARRVER